MHPSEIQLTNLSVGDLQSNPRGGKTAPLLVDGKQLKVKLRGVTTPFVCSAYDKTSVRKALDVRTDEALRYFVYELDAALLPFAGKLTCRPEGYKSLLKSQKEGYDPLFRMKLSLDDNGKTPVKFYNEKKERLAPDEIRDLDWRGISMNINLTIRSIFVNAGNWGCVAEPNCILTKLQDEDPFSEVEDDIDA